MPRNDNWNLDPPPGFQGLRDALPLRVYIRHMPHWRQQGATYFATFRLADSLPAARLNELKQLKIDWKAHNPEAQNKDSLERLARMVFERIENWLDQGMGSCLLREEQYSRLVHQSMQHFHGKRYELGASVVMPNHVHCIIRPIVPPIGPSMGPSMGPPLLNQEDQFELEDIIGSWKSFTARRINQSIEKECPLWQEESYDRIIRDEEHLWRCLQYIGRNPRKAGLTNNACRLWLNPDWENLGWRFLENW